MNGNTFTYSTYIGTTPEKLWEALTDSKFTRQYWGGLTLESDWKAGSPIKMIQPEGSRQPSKEGKILKADKPKVLSYTGIGSDENSEAVVTFEIVQLLPSQVRLNLTHENIAESKVAMAREGWFAFMSSLKSLLETGAALDYSWWRG
jgi:uncharacterized protein YndB with AHSA1/START domain